MVGELLRIRRHLMTYYYNFRWSNTLNHLQNLEKTQYLSSSDIENIQEKKLKNLIKYTYENVPFYRRTFKNLKLMPDDIRSIDDLEKLPILTKDIINDNFHDMVSVKYQKADLMPNSTGGSTGKNLNFYYDKKNYERILAAVLRGDSWAGLELGVKNAYLWGSQFDVSMQRTIINRFFNKIQGSLFLSSYELSDEKMQYYTNELLKHKPEVLVAYPSPLYVYANFLNENKIDIKLNSIISSAETLYDYQREFIESVFGCKIFNRYGCREFGPIACECEMHKGLHINSERLIVEFLAMNEYDNKVNIEEKSNLILTDLDNYAMPFIRYEIGDTGIPLEKCECDRNLPLMNVEGRKFDVIIGTNGNRLGGTFWTLLFRTYVDGIDEFQVIQEKRKKLEINIIINNNFLEDSLLDLENKIKEFCGLQMDINFNIVGHIPKNKSGKQRFIISKII